MHLCPADFADALLYEMGVGWVLRLVIGHGVAPFFSDGSRSVSDL